MVAMGNMFGLVIMRARKKERKKSSHLTRPHMSDNSS